jgi:hypothetical protein
MNCYTSPDNLITFSPDKKVVNLLRKRVVSLTGISNAGRFFFINDFRNIKDESILTSWQ